MKDTAGQCSYQHRMPSPSSQGLMSFNTLCLSKSNLWELRLGGENGEISTTACTILLFSLSASVKRKGRRAERESKLSLRNIGVSLQPGSIEPALNSSFHLLRPSHLLGHNHREVEIAVQHPRITRGVVPVQSDTSTAKQHSRNLQA